MRVFIQLLDINWKHCKAANFKPSAAFSIQSFGFQGSPDVMIKCIIWWPAGTIFFLACNCKTWKNEGASDGSRQKAELSAFLLRFFYICGIDELHVADLWNKIHCNYLPYILDPCVVPICFKYDGFLNAPTKRISTSNFAIAALR